MMPGKDTPRSLVIISILAVIILVFFTYTTILSDHSSNRCVDDITPSSEDLSEGIHTRAVIHVDAGGGQQFLTVQEGVNAANPADTVFIHDGIYAEHVTVSKGITLLGQSCGGTIIDAGGTGTGIYVTANDAVIKRLTVRNAPQSHSAIKLSVSNNCEISGCNITGNDEGITLWAAVSNSIHHNNITDNNGWNGGIYIENSNSNHVYGNKIAGNDWLGVKLSGADDNVIDNNTISNNSNGIMLYGASGGTDVHYNDIYGNEMWGVFVYDVNALQVDGRNNWWGNASGPRHDPGNLQGTGDNVTDHVTYRPWLRAKSDNEAPVIDTQDITTIPEDEFYNSTYRAADPDGDELEWSFATNATWIRWGTDNRTIYGTPDNSHVGWYWVRLNVSDGQGAFTERNFTLTVENVDPVLLTQDVGTVLEDTHYRNDYNSTDDGQGETSWSLDTNALFLSMDESTGLLNGTPDNDDVGTWWVDVHVKDGNGGTANSHFTLEVTNTNDPPLINTTDVTDINEDELYLVVYNATEVDVDDELVWSMSTNASWLRWGTSNNTLYGLPDNGDVGTYNVSINVSDGSEIDSRKFNITVHNVNDPPEQARILLPVNESELHLDETVLFEGRCSDPDELHGDVLNYSWSSNISGVLGYGESLSMDDLPRGVHRITFSVSDMAGCTVNASIVIIVKEPVMIETPTTFLREPENEAVVGNDTIDLTWGTGYSSPSMLEYTVMMGTSPDDLEPISEKQSGSNFTAEGLGDGVTYYWTVTPYRGHIKGWCDSGVWNFTVDLDDEGNGNGGYIGKLGIALRGPTVVTVTAGSFHSEKITIDNGGRVSTIIDMTLDDGGLTGISIDDTATVGASDSETVTLALDIPEGTAPGDYTVKITASLGTKTAAELSITVKVVTDDGGGGGGKPSTGGDSDDKGASDTMLVVIIVVAVILVLLALLVVIGLARKRRKDEERPSEIVTDTTYYSPHTPEARTSVQTSAQPQVFIPPQGPPIASLVFPTVRDAPPSSSAPSSIVENKRTVDSQAPEPDLGGSIESRKAPGDTGGPEPRVDEKPMDISDDDLLDDDELLDDDDLPDDDEDGSAEDEGGKEPPEHRGEDVRRVFAGLPEVKEEERVELPEVENVEAEEEEEVMEAPGTREYPDDDDEVIPVLEPMDE